MVTRRSRAHLAVPLTLVLLPLLLWAAAATSRVSVKRSWTHLHDNSPTAFQSVRTNPFDALAHHPVATPHPSSGAVIVAVPTRAAEGVSHVEQRPSRTVLARQHPARAPPAIA